jgi:hypothetical protein
MARYSGRAIGLYNQVRCNRVCQAALRNDKSRRILDPVYFDSLRVETLDDCAPVGGDGIRRSVIKLQLVFTDLQDDEVRAGWNRGIQALQDPRRRVPLTLGLSR